MQLRKTVLQFGMHQFPIKVGTMTRESSTGLKNSCPHCNALVGKVNKCGGCEKEIDSSELLKALPVSTTSEDGKSVEQLIIFTKEQVTELEGDTVIEILGKVAKSRIPRTRIMGGYIVRPDIDPKKKSSSKGKPWESLRHALLNSDNVLLARFTNRGKERMVAITTENSEMVMLSLAFNTDFILPDEVPPSLEITENEIAQATSFIDSMKEVEMDTVCDERKTKIEKAALSGEPIAIQIKGGDDGMSFFS